MTDIAKVPQHQMQIHSRLENWRRYVSSSARAWFVQPMFRQAKTPKQWEEDLHVAIPIDTQDGHVIEKAVSALPEKHRAVIRWAYVKPWIPISVVRRETGSTREGLFQLISEGRDMLKNRLK